jgi:hypothetical protein
MKNSKPAASKYNLSGIFWRLLLASGFIGLVLYALSFFFAKPTVETITTPAPSFDQNNQPARNVKYRANQRKR